MVKMSDGFVHSVKVPRLYKFSAKIVREVREKGGSLKSLIYQQKHPNVSAMYSLCLNTLNKDAQIDDLLNKTKLLVNEPRLDPWLAKILITELLWGKHALSSACKPVKTILSYEKRLKEELGKIKDVETFTETHKKVKRARYVRVNTLLMPIETGIAYFVQEGWNLLPKSSTYVDYLDALKNLEEPNFIQDFHVPDLLAFPSTTSFYDHPGYRTGEIILQDKASCFASFLLNPKPGSVVIDMCAAPGMKTTHLAALMKNNGKIYAVEINEQRYETLCKQVELTDATCVETIMQDALALRGQDYSNVEYILADATCSGSGMLERHIIYGKEKFDSQRLKQLKMFQIKILKHALRNFPSVKKVIYSTCSVNVEENEEVIDDILETVQDAYKLVPAKELFGENWLNFSSKKYKCSDKCFYARPKVDFCNGFFVAIFERNFNVPLPEYRHRLLQMSVNEDATENDQPKVIEVAASSKKKKRQKRKSASQKAAENETAVESILKSPSGLILVDNDNDISERKSELQSQDDSIELSESKDDDSPPKKKRKKREEIVEKKDIKNTKSTVK